MMISSSSGKGLHMKWPLLLRRLAPVLGDTEPCLMLIG